jgi:PTS system mannose-specific IIB component
MAAWFRIDNRLVHGQIIEAWIPYLGAAELVVANDRLAGDALRQQIMQLAIPERVRVHCVMMKNVKLLYDRLESSGENTLYLLADCRDAARLITEGVPVTALNVGNMHYCQGKRHLCAHVAVSQEDLQCLRGLHDRGVKLDFRSVPTDTPAIGEW